MNQSWENWSPEEQKAAGIPFIPMIVADYRTPQTPGLGGIDELTSAEESFIQNLAGLSYSEGDILYRNSSDLTNLAIGAANTFLRVNSGATAPKWGVFVDEETPSGTINGSNTAFVLANTPVPASSVRVYLNGSRRTGGGEDYTFSTATITFGSAPLTGSILRVDYRY